MSKMASKPSFTKLMIQLQYSGKRLSLPQSSNADLLNLLQQTEMILSKVRQSPSELIVNALNPVVKAIFAKEFVKHADVDVNVSVACCIAEIMRIMLPKLPCNDQQMKDLFEMVVIVFEKLSSAYGGCYAKMTQVMKRFSNMKLWVLMLDLEMDGYGLIVRLFKQFLTVAGSNSSAIILEMEKIMTMIIDESQELALKLLSLIVTIVKSDNLIPSPVCWQLGEKVLMNYAAQLKPNLLNIGRDMSIALYDYSKIVARVRDTALQNEIREAKETIPYATQKIKLECPETLKSCQGASRHTVGLLDVISRDKKHEKKSHPLKGKCNRNNSPWRKQAKSVEHGEHLVGSRIKVWWPKDKMYYPGVVTSFDYKNQRHKVLYDDGDEEVLNLERERWKIFCNNAGPGVTCVHGYNVQQSVAPVLEAIFNKHGDIAAKCVFTADSVRASLLEVVCEIVKQMETATHEVIEKMEEIESQLSSVEAVKINVSWLRAHLESINKRNGWVNGSAGGLGLLTGRA